MIDEETEMTEYETRVMRLIFVRGMSRRAAYTVVDAAMHGIGCIEGECEDCMEPGLRGPFYPENTI